MNIKVLLNEFENNNILTSWLGISLWNWKLCIFENAACKELFGFFENEKGKKNSIGP